jgi:hypothetical protein
MPALSASRRSGNWIDGHLQPWEAAQRGSQNARCLLTHCPKTFPPNVVAACNVAIEPLDFRDVSHAAIRTSCAEAALGEAEKQLAEYLGKKHEPKRGPDPLIAGPRTDDPPPTVRHHCPVFYLVVVLAFIAYEAATW